MGDLQFIESTLERAAQRRRNERAFRGLWQGLLVGAVIWLLALATYKLLPIPFWTLGAAAGVGLLSALVGLIIGGLRKIFGQENPRWADWGEHLQESPR